MSDLWSDRIDLTDLEAVIDEHGGLHVAYNLHEDLLCVKEQAKTDLRKKLRQQREDYLTQLKSLKNSFAISAGFITDKDDIEDRYYRKGLLEAESEIAAVIKIYEATLNATIDNNGEEG